MKIFAISILSFLFISTFSAPGFSQSKEKNKILKFGKYSCTASKYNNGFYEFVPRGSFTISKDGKYYYSGFTKPSSGTFKVDVKGDMLFKGGYLAGGKAQKTDQANKFLVVFPANPDNRWTCSCK